MDRFLRFLKEVPDKWILLIICLLTAIIYIFIRTEFTSQLLNTVISALVGLLIGHAKSDSKTTISNGDISASLSSSDETTRTLVNVGDTSGKPPDKIEE